LKHEITAESLAIYEAVVIQAQAQTTFRATTRRPTTRRTTTRSTPPPKVYCYTCTMQTCPLPFTPYRVSSDYSPNRWCIVCDE